MIYRVIHITTKYYWVNIFAKYSTPIVAFRGIRVTNEGNSYSSAFGSIQNHLTTWDRLKH